jgi:hypothetical protein
LPPCRRRGKQAILGPQDQTEWALIERLELVSDDQFKILITPVHEGHSGQRLALGPRSLF